MRKLKVIEVPCDLGAGCRGASLGVDSLRFEAKEKACYAYLKLPVSRVSADNSILNYPDPTPNAHYIEGIVKYYQQACELVAKSLSKNEFPLIIAGDHSTAGASIAGMKQYYPDKRVGVIWVDAHADIHSPYTTPSGNVHGMPLAAALHFDNKAEQINELSDLEEDFWQKLKNVGGPNAKINSEDIVYIGVRDTEEQEDSVLKTLKIPNITVRAAKDMGMEATAIKALGKLTDCDVIYISFDVDSMDPAVSEGTGTPVPGGFSAKEAAALLRFLYQSNKVKSLEVVEINPMLDKENKMAKATLSILSEIFDWE